MADKIVAEYTVKVDQALKDLNKLAARVDKVDDERKKVQNGFKDMSKGMAADFKKVGAAIGLAFGVDQLVSFGKEAVKVAAQAEGIRTAFARLNQPNLLNELRKATRGAVDDITLMRQAIRAQNFKVPLEQLGTFFEFATKRSIQTGESVDYLVNSIIDGIGRKSTLVLDNLGISATELQEEMKKTGDFGAAAGAIIARELEKAGDVADTTAIKLAKINTALDNIKVVAGEALINFGTGLLYLAGQVDTGIEATDGLSKAAQNLSKIYQDDVSGAVDKMLQKNQELLANQLKIAELEENRSYQNSRVAIQNINEQIEKLGERNVFLREYIKELKKIYEASQQQDPIEKEQIKNLAYYNQLIKDLQAEQADANTTREKVRQLEDEINEAIRQRLILLGKLREVGGETFESIEPIAKMELLQQQELTDDILADYAHRNGEIEAAIEKRNEMERQKAEERFNNELAFANQIAQEVTTIVGNIAAIQSNIIQEELNQLNVLLEQGQITREEYDTKRRQLLREQAESQKAAAIFQASVDGAVAVITAFKDGGPVLAALVGAAVATQVAAIASQPLPQFAEGGFVNEHGEIKGRKHAQGGVVIEAEGNEFITKGKYAQQNADILKAINSGQWEKYKMENIIAPAINQVLEGGLENMGASYSLQSNFNDKNLLRAIDRHRNSDKDGFVFLAQELKRLKPRKRGGFA